MDKVILVIIFTSLFLGCGGSGNCDALLKQMDSEVFSQLSVLECSIESGRDIQAIAIVSDSSNFFSGLQMKKVDGYRLDGWKRKLAEDWMLDSTCNSDVFSITRPCRGLCSDYELMAQKCSSGNYMIGVLGN